jgi:riboflavin-specific deaminase-like protein
LSSLKKNRMSISPRSGILEVAVNFAMTWDARVSTRGGTPADFSSPRDKHRLLEIRATGDALLVGRKTIEIDRMQMGLPDESLRAQRVARGQSAYPLRVLVSQSGVINPALRVFEGDFSPIVIFSSDRMPFDTRHALERKATLHFSDGPEVNLRAMLTTLAEEYGVQRLVCEGGPTLFRSLLEADLVDEINLTLCPLIFGGMAAPTLTGVAGDFLPVSRECCLEAMEVIEGECFVRYRVIG